MNMTNAVIGGLIGLVVGFAFYKLKGCPTGACLITSNPISSSLYGGFMGYLISGLF